MCARSARQDTWKEAAALAVATGLPASWHAADLNLVQKLLTLKFQMTE